MQEPFFSTGGTLSPDDPSYIERSADLELEVHLRAGQYVSLLDARQKGKSSLIARSIRKLNADGFRCIKIDLQRYGSNLTESQWCAGIAATIEQQSGDKTFLKRFAATAKPIGAIAALFNTISSLVDPSTSPNTIIFCDEIDFVRVLPFPSDGFFAAIRSLYNARSGNPNLNKLTFCLIGSASPNQLVQNQSTAPFDIAKTVILQDFTIEETRPYAKALPQKTDHPQTCLEQIHHWCAGHPFMTQTVCASLTTESDPSPQKVNAIISSVYLTKNAADKNAHLNQIANAFLAQGDQAYADLVPAALDTYRLILKSPQSISKYRADIINHLRICGLITIVDGIASPRNRIYTRVFNHAWIKANLPAAELQRQRAAARAATLKTSAVAATIVGITGWLAISNIDLAKRANTALTQSQSNETRAERQAYFSGIQVAGNQIQAGNWLAASKNVAQLAQSKNRGWEWYYLNQILNQQSESFQIGEPISNVTPMSNTTDFVALGRNELISFRGKSISKSHFPHPDLFTRRLSEDGKYLILRGSNSTSIIVNLAGETVFETPYAPAGFCPNSRYVFSQNASSNEIYIYSVSDWKLAHKITFTAPSLNSVHLDSKSPISIICMNNEVVGYNLATKSVVWRRSLQDASRVSTISHDGTSFYISFAAGSAEKWSRETGKTQVVFGNTKAPITILTESPTNKLIATGGADGIVKTYETNSPIAVNTFVGHSARIAGIWFTENGNALVSTSEDGNVRQWRIAGQNPVRFSKFGDESPISGVASKHGDRVAIGNMSGMLGLLKTDTGEVIFQMQDLPGEIPRLGFTNRDEYVFILSKTHGFQLRSSLDGRIVSQFKAFSQTVVDFEQHVEENVETLFTLGTNGELLKFTNYKNPAPIPLKNSSSTTRMGISPNGAFLAVGHIDGSLSLIKTSDNSEIGNFPLHRSSIRNITFSHDSRRLVTASNDETCAIFDVKLTKLIHRLVGHTSRVFTGRFSPNNTKILSISFDGTVRVWDTQSGELLHTLQHDSWVSDAEFSPDGARIISGGNDKALHVWDTNSGQELLALGDQKGSIFRTLFANEGKSIITLDATGTITLRPTEMPSSGISP